MGDDILLTAHYVHDGVSSLAWNFGYSADTIFNVSPVHAAYDHPGDYTVTIHVDYRVCPDSTYTAPVRVKSLPSVYLGPDTSMCLDDGGMRLKDGINEGNPAAKWLWSTGDTTSSIIVRHYGLYNVRVTVDQCSTTDEINIAKDCYVDVPNSFTPNGDGVNDYFFPRQLLSDGLRSFSLVIFNRWGQQVFQTENAGGRGWDGRFNGKDQPAGVYIYEIKAVMKNGRTEDYSGNVTLLR